MLDFIDCYNDSKYKLKTKYNDSSKLETSLLFYENQIDNSEIFLELEKNKIEIFQLGKNIEQKLKAAEDIYKKAFKYVDEFIDKQKKKKKPFKFKCTPPKLSMDKKSIIPGIIEFSTYKEEFDLI